LPPGSQAPDVSFRLQDGFELRLSGLRGKVVVVYFCRDHGDAACVREEGALRDRWAALEALHVAVVGVTGEDAATRQSVIAHERLPFDLAQDVGGSLAASFGFQPRADAPWHGFLIGRDGAVRAAWSASDPDAHVAEFLEAAR
jgi:peroxiredoxin Q/BCP